MTRVFVRHLQQTGLLAALRDRDRDLLAAPLREQFGADFRVLQLDRQQHLVGQVATARIKLGQEVGQDVFIGKLQILKTPALGRGQLSTPHHQDNGLDKAAFAIKPENILVDTPVMQHGLFLHRLFDRPHAVAQLGRLFELQPLGVVLHLLAHRLEQTRGRGPPAA